MIDREIHHFFDAVRSVLWRDWLESGIQYYYAEDSLYVIRKIDNAEYVYGFVEARSPSEACCKFLCRAGTQGAIESQCDKLKTMLLEKNRKYGDSALNPCRVFSRANAVEQILVRIDDKLNRIRNRQNDEDEDVVMDLAGYLILLMVAKEGLKR